MKQVQGSAVQDLFRGVAGVLILNGEAIAHAVRRFPVWIPALIVIAAGIPFGSFGVFWSLQVWGVFAISVHLMLKMFVAARHDPENQVSVFRLTGWTMVPLMIVALIFRANVIGFSLIAFISAIWGIAAFVVGWSALTKRSWRLAFLPCVIAFGIVCVMQVIWLIFIFTL